MTGPILFGVAGELARSFHRARRAQLTGTPLVRRALGLLPRALPRLPLPGANAGSVSRPSRPRRG